MDEVSQKAIICSVLLSASSMMITSATWTQDSANQAFCIIFGVVSFVAWLVVICNWNVSYTRTEER